MRFKILTILSLLTWIILPYSSQATFIADRESLVPYYGKQNVVIIASTGRSGSTMLTQQVTKYDARDKVLKTHLLPPDARFKGKILFIFSNPDQAAESALYMTLHHRKFAKNHFTYMETTDWEWLKRIGGPLHQTKEDNLLSYDALGIYDHLKIWLYTQTEPADPIDAQILAIKYENLWDRKTVQAIQTFLNIPYFTLPPKRARGRTESQLFPKEIAFKKTYNLGTKTDPRYAAYADARILWEQAPPIQYLKISP